MSRRPSAAAFVLPVAAAEALVLLAAANRYGYRRDELYFRVAALAEAPTPRRTTRTTSAASP